MWQQRQHTRGDKRVSNPDSPHPFIPSTSTNPTRTAPPLSPTPSFTRRFIAILCGQFCSSVRPLSPPLSEVTFNKKGDINDVLRILNAHTTYSKTTAKGGFVAFKKKCMMPVLERAFSIRQSQAAAGLSYPVIVAGDWNLTHAQILELMATRKLVKLDSDQNWSLKGAGSVFVACSSEALRFR
jgi:hypothetical protein